MKTLAEVDKALDDLEAWVLTMLAETSDDSQMEAFAAIANDISDAVPAEHHAHAWSRIQCILRDNGLIPGDDEPCSD